MVHTLLTSGYGNEVAALSFDPAAGSLTKTHTTQIANAPTWLTLSPTHDLAYTGAEFSEPDGVLTALAFDRATGAVREVSTATVGAGPVHFALSRDGTSLYSANYGSGSVSRVQLDADGTFVPGSSESLSFKGTGPNKARQEAPHPHGIYVDPTGKYLLCADLGTDVLRVFDIASGAPVALPSISLPPGNGPRHLLLASPTAAASGKTLLYLIEELSNTIAVFEVEYPRDGAEQPALSLKEIQREVSILPADATDTPGDWTAAELAFSPCGRFLYASNRSPVDNPAAYDTLTVFSLAASGALVVPPVQYVNLGGRGPRHFSLDPSGQFVAVALERTSEAVVFRIGEGSKGDELVEVARVKDVKQPTCIVWLS
ncbi:hypothetical protein Rhopal_002662-T1 [Rhodotorula paludigena]|uniref:6-phosphogluconolactonase n=1 Tax=Rhodotorula paludigena TaxID=86838 RepID=A0AAV5GAU5_9BASI|nr:hypothetical protein Rhopal_002662-T1 [Rhodotorula paludigena]